MRIEIKKDNWTPCTLGEVVTKKEENDKENARVRFDRFLKVEHMDAESLHIKRWASQENGDELNPYFYKIFRKGQVLFPTRNPHLRRTALASFDGICGEKTLTLEPIKSLVIPEFIPFLFHSEVFYAHSTGAIIGSTNPHVRWRDVANFKFLLPPKEQQAKLAELLWAMDEVIDSEIILRAKLEIFLNTIIENEIHGVELKGKVIREVLEELSSHEDVPSISELGKFLKGKGIPKSVVQDVGIPCVRYGELYTRHNRIIREYYSFISEEIKSESLLLQKHDVLFAGSGETITEIGKSAAFIDEIEAYVGGDTLIFRPFDMDGYYLGYLLNSQLVRQQLNKYGTGATIMHIYIADLEKVKVPKIDREKQIEIGRKLESITTTISKLDSKIINSKTLQKSLINQIF